MESLHTKDCNHSKVSSPNFESFESKDSDLDEYTNEISESFDTKLGNDTEVSSGNIITEGEMEQAEVVMAAKNIVDRIQGMVEDLGEILNEDLPPLADTITDQFGAEASAAFAAQP